MTSETPSGPTARDRPTEPFTKGRITWGRPPQTVFRVGPLPRAASSTFVTPQAPRQAPGILSGSMVPPARPADPVPADPVEPEVRDFALAEGEVVHEPVQPTPPPPERELEPEPERVVIVDADPAAVATPPRETVVEVEEAEPATTVPPLLSDSAAPKAEPRSLPSVVVTPAIYATVSAAIETVTKKDRWIVVAAVLAVIVTGGFIWLATLPGGGASELDLDAPPPAAQGLTVEVVEPAVPAEPAVPVEAAGVAPTRERPAVVAPTEIARPDSPVATPPVAPSVEPRPYIETAPLVVEAPTAARPAPSDPDAPISTQPQPLD